jgi:hypothetical protein
MEPHDDEGGEAIAMEPHDDDAGEVIAGEDGYDVRVGFADHCIALVLVSHAEGEPATRAHLTRENALRLSVELELAAGSLSGQPPADERRRGPADRRRRRVEPR